MKVIAGNWKMNHTPETAASFFAEFGASPSAPVRIVVFPPALSFGAAAAAVKTHGRSVELGVQNVHWEKDGAFTGENSVDMARSAGAGLVLIGHSERRHVFGETDDEVRRKVAAVQAPGLEPVVCVGETLDERRAGDLEAVLDRQVSAFVDLVTPDRFMIAYEPVWAIGTGETATPADASEAHGIIRSVLSRAGKPSDIPILYGGSVKPENAAGLLGAPDVDGVLVGGASLDPAAFGGIAEAAPAE